MVKILKMVSIELFFSVVVNFRRGYGLTYSRKWQNSKVGYVVFSKD
jgi:hypothetical protein